MEVMGLMLGEFVDDYTVKVVDVFAMPQSGTGVSVEAVDPVFQTKMLDMLKQCGRYAAVPTAASHSITLMCHLHMHSKARCGNQLGPQTLPVSCESWPCRLSVFAQQTVASGN